MWCPNCEKEYDGGANSCPDCGRELVSSYSGEKAMARWSLSTGKNVAECWPRNPDGTPENVAFLTHCTSLNYEDVMLINMLDAYGIPAIKEYPANGTLGKVILGMSGNGADIYVPMSMLEEAKQLLEDQHND